MSIAQRLVNHCGRGRTLQEAMARDNLLPWVVGRGKELFVDTIAGGSSNDGERKDDAMATITQALAKCVADRRDVITVLRYGWTAPTAEVFPLAMDVAGVTLRGLRGGNYGHGGAADIITTGQAVIHISTHEINIQNLHLRTDGASDVITFEDRPTDGGIYDCLFTGGKDAIGGGAAMGTTPAQRWVIAGNFFAHEIMDHGIYIFDSAYIKLLNNIFHLCQGSIAMELHQPGRATVMGNSFGLNASAVGAAITVGVNAIDCLFDLNRANFGVTAMSDNPFLDYSTSTWLMNYQGVTATMPATTT